MTPTPGRPGRPRAPRGGGRAQAGGPRAAGLGARLPDGGGHFGRYGGRFVPETLMSPLVELERAYAAARRDRGFQTRLARLLGARVVPVESGSRTLKDAVNEALRDWVTNVRTTYYLLGSALGPHPYPVMVRDFHTVIGREARRQVRAATGRGPDYLLACVGGGSNAIGLFHPFIGDRRVRIVGVEAGGHGLASGRHGASLCAGRVGVLHGSMSYLLQDEDGQVATAHSISAGLDYPGVGPELAYYKDAGRFEFVSITDEEALAAFQALARLEGIMPALESAHAVAHAMRLAKGLPRRQTIVVGLSGRGDKDVQVVSGALGR